MKTFTIDSDNNISVFASKKEAAAASTLVFVGSVRSQNVPFSGRELASRTE